MAPRPQNSVERAGGFDDIQGSGEQISDARPSSTGRPQYNPHRYRPFVKMNRSVRASPSPVNANSSRQRIPPKMMNEDVDLPATTNRRASRTPQRSSPANAPESPIPHWSCSSTPRYQSDSKRSQGGRWSRSGVVETPPTQTPTPSLRPYSVDVQYGSQADQTLRAQTSLGIHGQEHLSFSRFLDESAGGMPSRAVSAMGRAAHEAYFNQLGERAPGYSRGAETPSLEPGLDSLAVLPVFSPSPEPGVGEQGTRPEIGASLPSEADPSGGGRKTPRVPIQEKMVLWDRLSTPKDRTALSDRLRRKICNREYEVYAENACSELGMEFLVDVPAHLADGRMLDGGSSTAAYEDPWHTADDDGYRSAVLHAAVKCREILRNAGLADVRSGPGGPEQVTFGSSRESISGRGSDAPELARLHTSCLLFEELCGVRSPLQDTLKFLFQECCRCIFDGFRPGIDVLSKTPFFALLFQARQDLASANEELQSVYKDRDHHAEMAQQYKTELAQLRAEIDSMRAVAAQKGQDRDVLVKERDVLREESLRYQHLVTVQAEEFQSLNREFLELQGKAHSDGRVLQRTQGDLKQMTTQLKSKLTAIGGLQNQVSDLQVSLNALYSPDDAVEASDVELPADAEISSLLHKNNSQAGHALPGGQLGARDARELPPPPLLETGQDNRSFLRVRLPDGEHQLIVRGEADRSTMQEMGPLTAAGRPPAVVVSREAFAAILIAMALPRLRMDPTTFDDDESLVIEVRREMEQLVRDHKSLMEAFRQLRQELKDTLHLIPEYNQDELRGILKTPLLLDAEEAALVPSPVSTHHLVALGEDKTVPSYLRYEGTIRLKAFTSSSVYKHCRQIWVLKTTQDLKIMGRGHRRKDLGEFLSDSYLPSVDKRKSAQMEFIYNFLLGVRKQTTLAETQTGSTSTKPQKRQSLMQQKEREKQEKQQKELQDKQNKDQDKTSEKQSPEEQDQDKPGGPGDPQLDFVNECEVLYRGLLGDIHEDAFHDQTAMIVAFYKCLNVIWERLHPLDSIETEGATFSLAEFSAMQRAFFRGKPREHVNTLKKLLSYIFQEAYKDDPAIAEKKPWEHRLDIRSLFGVRSAEMSPEELAEEAQLQLEGEDENLDTQQSSKLGSMSVSQVPGSLNLRKQSSTEDIWHVIITRPTPFIQELRRQHFVECLAFFDRLRKSLHSIVAKELEAKQVAPTKKKKEEEQHVTDDIEKDDKREDLSLASAHVGPKHVLEALRLADHNLTEDQKSIYLVRGFGQKLPDMHSKQSRSSMDSNLDAGHSINTKDLMRKAAALEKGLKLLRDHTNELIDNPRSTVPVDTFLRNLGSSGVIKPARLWVPAVNVKDIIKGSGLDTERSKTVGGALEEFFLEHPEEMEETEVDPGGVDNPFRDVSEIHEVSVGYPSLSLAHWISH